MAARCNLSPGERAHSLALIRAEFGMNDKDDGDDRDDKGDKKEKKGFLPILHAGVAAGAALLGVGAAAPAAAGIAAGGVLGAAILENVGNYLHERQRRRWETLLRAYTEDSSQEPAQFECHTVESKDPHSRELLLEFGHTLAQAPSDLVVPVLARMARAYRDDGSRADAFFRSVRRLLTELDDDEFAALGRLVNLVMDLDIVRAVPSVELQYFPAEHQAPERTTVQIKRILTYYRPSTAEHLAATGARVQRIVIDDSPPHLLRIFHLLKVNDLAVEPRAGAGLDSFTGREVIVFDVPTLKRIDRILRPGRSGKPVGEPSRRAP
jgi:hypothetical protein